MGGERDLRGLAELCPAPTPKRFHAGTVRARRPEDTWSALEPHLTGLEITRVANVTGLDRIGIPVWMAVRPRARSLAVTQGKGVDDVAAKVSAVMEAVEAAVAEVPPTELRHVSYEELAADPAGTRVPDPDALPRPRASLFGTRRALDWTVAVELRTAERWWVPNELVHTDYRVPWPPGSGSFLCTTNGLASGNTVAEALLHGLCEVVERDALSCWGAGDDGARAERRIDPTTIDDDVARALLDRYDRAGVQVALWDVTSDVDVPVVRAIILDADADPDLNPVPAAFGSGCHPDPAVALARALTEAAQSRLTTIAGSRDDLSRAGHRTLSSRAAIEHHQRVLAEPATRPFRGGPPTGGDTIDDDVATVVDRLAEAGFDHALAVVLEPGELPVAVARVVVPGLEGADESPAYLPGPRARAVRGW